MRKRTTFLVFIVFAALILHSLQCSAQWTQGAGIDGGDIRYLTKIGTDIYAGSWYGGIFRSSDNGGNWTPLMNGLPTGLPVGSIIANDGFLFAGTTYWGVQAKGIYRSDDNGATWVQKNNGIQYDTLNSWNVANLSITGLAVCGNYVFAATGANGIYRTDNHGETWTYAASDTLMEYYQVRDIHAIGTMLFAGTYNGGFFRSTDFGVTWTQHNTGLPTGAVVSDITSSGVNLYILGGGGVHWSPNNGDYWIPLATCSGGETSALSVDGNTLFYSTVNASGGPQTYKSINGGSSWTNIPAISGDGGLGHAVYALLNTGNYVLAGNLGNYGISSNGGGVVRSTDGGETWTEGSVGLSALNCNAITSHGTDIFAGTRYYSGIYKSSDNGANWTKTLLPGTTTNSQVLSLHSAGSTIYAGILSSGVYKSTDNGLTWATTASVGSAVYALASNETYIFAGTSNSGMRRSSNNGATWATINTGLTTIQQKTVRAIAVNGSNIYIGTSNGVFRSANDGTNWVAANGGSGSPGYNAFVRSLVVKGDTLFAGLHLGVGQTAGVIRSYDKGVTWELVFSQSGILVVWSLVLDGQTLYAGGSSGTNSPGGVYVSNDWGETWSSLNATFPTAPEVYSLHKANNTLFAGTYGQSVWQYSMAQAPASFAVTGGGAYCQGTSGIPVGVSNSETGVTYTLYKDAIAQVPTVAGTGSAITFGNQTAGTYTVEGTNSSGTTPMTGSAVITETPAVAVSVTISADINPVPAGSDVTLTAVPVNGGSSPSYQWKVNGINSGTDNPLFTFTPAHNDAVTCILTSNEACATGNPALSNEIILSVIPDTIALQNIVVANGQTNCYDALQTITIAGNGTTFTVQAGGSATMIAGERIIYLPGTTVEPGGYMHGYISTEFCSNPANPAVSNPLKESLSLEDIKSSISNGNVKVYPNPVNDHFTIELSGNLPEEVIRMEVIGINGIRIFSIEMLNGQWQTFSAAHLQPGLYFIHLITGNTIQVVKLVKL